MINKMCLKCKTNKPSEAFGKNRSRQDGLQDWCKECSREYRKTKRCQVSKRKYWRSEKGKEAKREYYQTPIGKTINQNQTKRRHRLYPERTYARQAIQRAIKSGKMTRPDTCSVCGVPCEPVGHHRDYSKPLEVIWVCGICHSAEHKITGKDKHEN